MGLHWVMTLRAQERRIPEEMKPKIEDVGEQIAEEEYMDLGRRYGSWIKWRNKQVHSFLSSLEYCDHQVREISAGCAAQF
jgi:hypothetical protein